MEIIISSKVILKEIRIPSSVTKMWGLVFSGWTEEQTIYLPFKEGEIPNEWFNSWNFGCSAKVVKF